MREYAVSYTQSSDLPGAAARLIDVFVLSSGLVSSRGLAADLFKITNQYFENPGARLSKH